ncbi:hemerythrin domain-containing protein [Promicromonospora panici]|uniref:hemerythrin domain-containing protein n=1 Tax=Promicromonospora panici TaxID=2219658 RepID=UPI00101CC07A|nr:hemerythrin domain-containing protein [Promicromonospora panici]
MSQRVVAWGRELREVHKRLRDALGLARSAVEAGGSGPTAARDLQLYCVGFCAALTGHHRSEDATLFDVVLAAEPDLAPVIADLKRDHSMLDHLLGGLERAARSGAEQGELLRHLDGIEAVMETHFRFEEKKLVEVLDAADHPAADRQKMLGPLA